MPTPIVFDAFSRQLAAGFVESNYIRMRTGFLRFFGRPGSFTTYSPDANTLDIDIVRGSQKLAALVPRGQLGRFLGTTHATGQVNRGTTFSRKYPLIEEEVALGADQLLSRVIGQEGPYERASRSDRLRMLARHGYIELTQRIVCLMEYLAAQSVILGKQSAQRVGTPGTDDYDWKRASGNTITATNGWANASGVPLTDIDAAIQQLIYTGKAMPNMLILGRAALMGLIANAQITTNYGNKFYFDLLRFTMDFRPDPEFAPFVASGFIPFGKLRTPRGYDLTIFTYPWLYDSAGTATLYLNDNYAVFASTEARADRYFGPPERLPMTGMDQAEMMDLFGFNANAAPMPMGVLGGELLAPGMFYPDAYVAGDRKSVTLRIQGAPVFPTVQTDAFGYITNAGSSS